MMRSTRGDGRATIGRIIDDAYGNEAVQYFSVRTGDRAAIFAGDPATWIEHVFRQ